MYSSDRLLANAPMPPGPRCDESGIHFSVFASSADLIELCLFDPSGKQELARLPFPECTDGVWHGYLEGGTAGLLYGYRAYGPFDPNQGQRYNPHKLLVDPYARALHGTLRWHDALYGYRVGATQADLSFDPRDSAPYMPKSVIIDAPFDWGDDKPPGVPWSETIIYELHTRGFSRRRGDLPDSERGTLAALGSNTTIDYLQRLGITSIELLPIQAFVRERELQGRNLTNYWGYNPLVFFALENAYLGAGGAGSFKQAIRRLHAAGLEVLLDVVYNHTGEGDEMGPTLSLRGLDNTAYYRLRADAPRFYVNDTGCGNTLNFGNGRVIQLVMDALRYWVNEFHIDGFRFDLGVTLGRDCGEFDPGGGFFDALLQDPVLSRVKLIFEPWDIGPSGYRLGQFPAGSAEWNDRFRNDVRRFWRGDGGQRGNMAARLQASADLFDHDRRWPWASINFITAHDGFTLADLVSYNGKHNLANGEGNRDGIDDNASHNWGHEGPTDNTTIPRVRDTVARSCLISLLSAVGTPMLLAGDEFGQTQLGNNNAYCQDNPTTWLDWTLLETRAGASLHEFVTRLIALRKQTSLMHCAHFEELAPDAEHNAVNWFDESGLPLSETDWDNASARLLCLQRLGRNRRGGIDALLLLMNSDSVAHRFHLPPPAFDYRIAIASHDAPGDQTLSENICEVAAHACVLLIAMAGPSREIPGEKPGNEDSLSGDMLRDDPEPGGENADILIDDTDQETPPGGDVLIDDEPDEPAR